MISPLVQRQMSLEVPAHRKLLSAQPAHERLAQRVAMEPANVSLTRRRIRKRHQTETTLFSSHTAVDTR